MDLHDGLELCGGAATTARLLEVGVPARAMRVARRSDLHLGRGRFALPGAPPALVAAVRYGGFASHSSAAALHGFPSWRACPVLHVTVPPGSRPADPGVRIHRGHLSPDDVHWHLPMTNPLRTVIDCARTMPLIDALVVIDAALRGGRVRREQLQAAADAARGYGAAALRQAVAFADELAASPLESVLRFLASILNCEVRSQVRLPGLTPVDLLLDGWLVLEADGYEFHSGRAEYRKDRRRANRLAELGMVLLRFTWEDLALRPGEVLAQIARVLAAGPPRRFREELQLVR
jgi:very-short-patch-repair endonuclease